MCFFFSFGNCFYPLSQRTLIALRPYFRAANNHIEGTSDMLCTEGCRRDDCEWNHVRLVSGVYNSTGRRIQSLPLAKSFLCAAAGAGDRDPFYREYRTGRTGRIVDAVG